MNLFEYINNIILYLYYNSILIFINDNEHVFNSLSKRILLDTPIWYLPLILTTYTASYNTIVELPSVEDHYYIILKILKHLRISRKSWEDVST